MPLCISIMERLDMRVLLSGPHWPAACCISSVNKERRGGQRRSEGLRFSYHRNGINGHVGFKLAPGASGGLIVFLSVISRSPPLLSLFLSLLTSFSPLSPRGGNLFPTLSPFLPGSPAHQSSLPSALWMQYSRQRDVRIKECDGSQWEYTARCVDGPKEHLQYLMKATELSQGTGWYVPREVWGPLEKNGKTSP